MNAKDRKLMGAKPGNSPHKGAQGSGSSGGMAAKGTVGSGSIGGTLSRGAQGCTGGMKKGY